jgi:hypothetical protein
MVARDAVHAKSEYQTDSEAVLALTAKLWAEQLERDAVIPLAARQAIVRRSRSGSTGLQSQQPCKGGLAFRLCDRTNVVQMYDVQPAPS